VIALQRKYEFYAIFQYETESISIEFPDLPGCFSYGQTEDEAISMAAEALNLYLEGCPIEHIPEPSNLDQIRKPLFNHRIVLIETELVV
jgi:predicted RNase H-like HicB family nuclease